MTVPETSPSSDYKRALKERILQHTNLTPVIRAIRNGEYTSEINDQELDKKFQIWSTDGELTPQYEVAAALWDRLKIERNALSAIFAQEVWANGFRRRTNFRPVSDQSSYWKLVLDTEKVMDDAIQEWQTIRDDRLKWRQGEYDTLDRAYDRYKKMVLYGAANEVIKVSSPGEYLSAGISTAGKTSWGLIRKVEHLSKGLDLSIAEKVAIIEEAYPKVIPIVASLNQDIGIPILRAWGFRQDTASDQEYFSLVEKDGKYSLVLDHEAMMQITDSRGRLVFQKQSETETTWCPARYSEPGEPDIIKEHFEWILSIAEKHYLTSQVSPEVARSRSSWKALREQMRLIMRRTH